MKYKLVIFDLDGTILDTIEDLTDSVNHVLRMFDYPERTVSEIRQFVGNGIRKTIERAVPNETDVDQIDKIYSAFNIYYKTHNLVKTRPYIGIKESIIQLHDSGIKTAVVSNKADYAVQDLINHFFAGCFDYAVGEKDGVRRKPAPDAINTVLNVLNMTSDDAIYVGDSEVDIQTAANAGLNHIIVTWGFRDRTFLENAGARVFANKPEDILKIVVS